MSAKTAEKLKQENGRSESPPEAKESSGSSTGAAANASSFTNGHGAVNNSPRVDSDADSSIAAEDSLCATPSRAKFKVPSQRPRMSKSEKRKGSNTSFSHENFRVMEMERELKKIMAERNQLSKQLYTSKQENAKLEGKVQVAMRDKSALASQMASLAKHNRDLSRGKSILLAKAYSSVDVSKTRSLQQSLKQANREKRAKQKELERLEIQMNMSSKQMQEKLLAFLDEREEMESKIEDLECELQHVAECHAASEEANNELKAKLASQEESLQLLREKETQLQLAIQEREKEFCEERERLTADAEQLKSNLQLAQEKIDELDKTVLAIEGQLSQTSDDLLNVQSQLQSVSSELEGERVREQETRDQLTECQRQLKEEGERATSLERNISELSQLNSDLNSQLKCVQGEVEVEREERLRVDNELAQSTSQLQQAGESVATLEQRVTELCQLNSDLQTQLKSERDKLEAERQEKKAVQEDLANTSGKLLENETQRKREQESHAGALEAAHTKCSNLLSELEKAVREGREAQTLLQNQMASLETDKQKAEEEVAEVREREMVAEGKLTELEKRNSELEVLRSAAVEQLEKTKEQLSSLQDQVDGPLSQEAEVAVKREVQKELEEAQTKLTQHEKQSKSVRDELEGRVQELEDELERMKMEREQLEVAYLDLQEKCRPFQDQLEGLTDINALLKSQAALARREAQEASDQFASLVGHQNTRQKIRYVKKIRDENSALKLEINQLRMELSKQKKHIRKLHCETKTATAALTSTNPPPPSRPLSSRN